MRRLCTGLLFVLALVACEHAQSRQVMNPDGSQGWFIECRHDQGACLDEAAVRCPRGYDVEGAEQHAGPTIIQGNGYGGTYVHHTFRGSMAIKCKDDAQPALPAYIPPAPLAQPAPPPAVPAGPGCRGDTDCKGGRKCAAGQCVSHWTDAAGEECGVLTDGSVRCHN